MNIIDILKRIFQPQAKRNKTDKGLAKDSFELAKSTIEIKVNTEIHPIYKKELPNGLLPGEVVLLDWLKGHEEPEDFPKYFSYQYGIDAWSSYKRLLLEGYIAHATPEESLTTLTVVDLKEILRSKNLKVTGKKAELIERIKENFTSEEIAAFIKKHVLTLTDKGKQVLEEYYYIPAAHWKSSKDGVYNVASAIQYVNQHKGRPKNEEISWNLLQQSFKKNLKQGDYGIARNVVLSMAEQLKKERKFVDALDFYIRVFIMDLSGLSNNRILDEPESVMLAPGIIREIKKFSENLQKEELNMIFSKSWSEIRPLLPFHYFDEQTCFQCLLAIFNDDDDFERYIRSKLKKAFKKIDRNILKKHGIRILREWLYSQ